MSYFVFKVYLHTKEGYEIADKIVVEADTLEEAERRLLEEVTMSRYSILYVLSLWEAKIYETYGYKIIKKEV